MKHFKVIFTLIAILLVGNLFAGTLTYVDSTGAYTATEWSLGVNAKTVTLPEYDRANELLSATLTLEFFIDQDLAIEYTGDAVSPVTGEGNCTAYWRDVPDQIDDVVNFTVSTTTGLQFYQPYDGVTDFGGTSGATYTGKLGDQSYAPIVYNGGDEDQFIGSSNFDLLTWTLSGFSVTGGGGNAVMQVNTAAYAKATIVYEFEGTLPVEFASFNASVTTGNFAQLTWLTHSESNLSGFDVLRSTDPNIAASQKLTQSMIAPANTVIGKKYTWIDNSSEAGNTYYYWVRSTNFDGTTSFHGPVSILIEDDNNNGTTTPVVAKVSGINSIYPNPFNPTANIKYSIPTASNVTIDVYNVMGQKVASMDEGYRSAGDNISAAWNGVSTTGHDLPSGIYFFKLMANDTVSVQKAIMLK